jgi:hypothetical protein
MMRKKEMKVLKKSRRNLLEMMITRRNLMVMMMS